MKCQGKTNKGRPCTKTVKEQYCCFHLSQCVVCYKNVKIDEKADNLCKHTMHSRCVKDNCVVCKEPIYFKPIKKPSKSRITTDCSICLEEVEEKDDCYLSCGHGHHVDCIKKLVKNECPICRSVLKFNKPTSINVKNIEKKEAVYNQQLKKEQETQTRLLVNELSNKKDDVYELSRQQYETEQDSLLFEIMEKSIYEC